MSTKPRNEIATMEQMKEIAQEQLKTRLYSKGADSGEVVAALGVRLALEIENLPKKSTWKTWRQYRRLQRHIVRLAPRWGRFPTK